MKALLICIILFASSQAFSHQPKRGKIHAAFGPYLYQTHLKRDYPGLRSNRLLGAGITVNGDVDRNGGVEAGMFYMHKLFFRKVDTQVVVEKVKRMYITLGYRHWFDEAFSFAGALYSSYLMGDPRIIHSDFASEAASPDTSALDNVDYGVDLSLQWEFLRQKNYSFLADLRYSFATTSRDQEDSDHRALFIAYKVRMKR